MPGVGTRPLRMSSGTEALAIAAQYCSANPSRSTGISRCSPWSFSGDCATLRLRRSRPEREPALGWTAGTTFGARARA